MDEENKKVENKMDEKIQNAVSKELSEYMNPIAKQGSDSFDYSKNIQPEKIPVQKFNPIIRTYKSDAEEIIQSGHISSINMAVAENKRMVERLKQSGEEVKKTNTNKIIIIVSSVLIAIGFLVFGISFLLNKNTDTKIPIVTEIPKIMTADIEEKIDIGSINLSRIKTTIKERIVQSATKLGQIKQFTLFENDGISNNIINSTKFIGLLKLNIPDKLLRNIKPEYFLGMHNFDGNQKFMILKTSSYDVTFAEMLSWENYLWQDFKEIFELNSGETSLNGENQNIGIEVKQFQDMIFSNKDCRVVKDTSGKIVFLYSIINPETVLITTNTNTLKEIINRVNRAKTIIQ
ncbi:MAG: hypothetical protein WCG60_00445 [bacterium]